MADHHSSSANVSNPLAPPFDFDDSRTRIISKIRMATLGKGAHGTETTKTGARALPTATTIMKIATVSN